MCGFSFKEDPASSYLLRGSVLSLLAISAKQTEGSKAAMKKGRQEWMDGGREGGRKGESFADKNAAEFGIT